VTDKEIQINFLKTNLISLLDKIENDEYYTLEVSVDALCSIARYFERLGGDYQRRVKLNEEFKSDK
tara:strand:- start:36 stop:233 length:198 start_codon:yes stop_codon:yes gene_type:complete